MPCSAHSARAASACARAAGSPRPTARQPEGGHRKSRVRASLRVVPGLSPLPNGPAVPSASRAGGGNRQRRQRPRQRIALRLSASRPDSRTILVSSSTNSGTPSVLGTTCSTTSGGSALLTRYRLVISTAWRRGKRGSVTWGEARAPGPGCKSGRKVHSAMMRVVGP